ncbi:MAG: MBL fold metallo-hydrolase [Candidatus Caldarchaeum sp.]
MNRLVILGAGSIVPTDNRFASGLLLETANTRILFDPGPSTISKLIKLNIQVHDIDAFFITHFHLDHVGDLPALIMLWPYSSEGTPLNNPPKLRLVGPKNLKTLVNQIVYIDAFRYLVTTMRCENYLEVLELKADHRYSVGDCVVSCAEVDHYNGLAYRIGFQGFSVVYSGDTVPDERLIMLAQGCDVLVHECSFPHEQLVGKHTSEKQLAAIVERIKPKKLVVTHLYPAWRGREVEIIEAVKSVGIDDVVVAQDMTVVEL